jgi:hypothetical protein
VRCECCNKMLSDKEATARFAPVNEEEKKNPRYVMMCTECQGFLPPSVKILTRADLKDGREEFDGFNNQGEYDRFVDDFWMSQEDRYE